MLTVVCEFRIGRNIVMAIFAVHRRGLVLLRDGQHCVGSTAVEDAKTYIVNDSDVDVWCLLWRLRWWVVTWIVMASDKMLLTLHLVGNLLASCPFPLLPRLYSVLVLAIGRTRAERGGSGCDDSRVGAITWGNGRG